ncbi:hypothetical protein ACFVVX_28445 [Kitasatospora sp. NPDC058170]|uniref:hypothetical protein n=1 Tax=Kitasatospora sp. NPDC058170 TaxID=3346364 RepID=UPI0036DEF6BB
MGRTARIGGSATRCALAVLLAAVIALVTGAGTADSLHRLALDRCTAAEELPAAPAVPFDADDCPEPGERRRDHGNAPAGASTHRVGHSRAPLPGLLTPGPRSAVGPAPRSSPGPAADRHTDRARPDAGRGVVLRC